MKFRRVILVNTAAPDRPNGSMVRYAAMVRDALARHGRGEFQVEELHLAPTQAWLNHFPRGLQTSVRYLCIAANACRRLPKQRAGLLHLLDGSHAYLLDAARKLPAPLAITVHDMIPALRLHGDFLGGRPGRVGGWIIRRTTVNLARADVVMADSGNTRDDVIRLAGIEPGRVQVVHPAAGPPDGAPPGDRRRAAVPFILHVAGNNTFYKNRPGVVDIFKIIRHSAPVELKMVGAPPDAALLKKVESSGMGPAIEFLSNVSEAELADLYRGAALLLFPSIYEGFGWPPLEAMSHGCPVVCSNAGSLPEVVGAAALIAPAGDSAALAGFSLQLLRDPDRRSRLVAAGFRQVRQFTMEGLARGLIDAYRRAEAGFP